MSNQEHIKNFLRNFGLTENQIKIYCVLGSTGCQKATSIAKRLRIHKMQVYRDLDEMEKKGAIQLVFLEPKQFIATPIDNLIDEKIQQLGNDLEDLELHRRKISDEWKNHLLSESPQRIERFAIIQGQKKLTATVEGLRKKAQREMCALLPLKTLVRVNLSGQHDKIMNGQVRFKYRVLTTIPDEEVPRSREVLQRLSQCKNVEVHYTTAPLEPFPTFGLIDDEEIVLITQHQQDCDISSLWTNNKIIVKLTKNFFEKLWIDSSDVQIILDTLPPNNPKVNT